MNPCPPFGALRRASSTLGWKINARGVCVRRRRNQLIRSLSYTFTNVRLQRYSQWPDHANFPQEELNYDFISLKKMCGSRTVHKVRDLIICVMYREGPGSLRYRLVFKPRFYSRLSKISGFNRIATHHRTFYYHKPA